MLEKLQNHDVSNVDKLILFTYVCWMEGSGQRLEKEETYAENVWVFLKSLL